MKTLHLLRHAKSSWDEPGLPDRERGLNRRGLRDAPNMGAALAQLIEPTVVAVSSARRAQMTLQGLCSRWPALAAMEHEVEEDLYTFSSQKLIDWIVGGDDQRDEIFIIGHNPALTDLVNELAREYRLANLPTAGYVQLSLDIDRWGQLMHCVAVVELSLFPKQLK
jgi:phosphohistidine phosphatase